MALERELKLRTSETFVLPDLADGANGLAVEQVATVGLDAVYYDTPTLSLARSGATLRARTGESGPAWTVKLPVANGAKGITRREVVFDAPCDQIPPDARELVRGYARSQELTPVARIHTDRTHVTLTAGGRPVAIVCDDVVTTEPDTGGPRRFREIELETVEPKDAGALRAIRRRLLAAGCTTDDAQLSKLVRVLGPRAQIPPDVAVHDTETSRDVTEVVRAAIARSVQALIHHHAGVRLGEPHGAHQFRVAARRLRSDLRTFAPLLDPDSSGWLRGELAWLGGEVGAVRDADVLGARLRERIQLLPAADGARAQPLLDRLAATSAAGRQALLVALSGERYRLLLDALVATTSELRLAGDAPARSRSKDTEAVLVDLVKRPWRHLGRAVAALPDDPPDEALHRVRIKAKRARYAIEAAGPAIGRDARRLASAVAEVQEVLGAHQDSNVAEAWLRDASAELPATGVAAGMLIGFEWADRRRTADAFARAWRRATRPKLTAWLG